MDESKREEDMTQMKFDIEELRRKQDERRTGHANQAKSRAAKKREARAAP